VPTLRALLLASLAHLGIALLATTPLLLSPTTRLIGHPDVDVWNHAWGPWWFWSCLSQGELPLATRYLAAPDGGRLFFPDLLGALVGAPLEPLAGVVLTWNLVVLFHVGLASVAGRALARAVGAGKRESWLGAAALACSPYLLSEVHNGISEAMALGAPVLALAALISALKHGGWARWLGLGLAAGLTLAGTAYYSLGVAFVAVPLVADALVRQAGRRREILGGMLGAVAVAVLLGGPVLAAAWWTVQTDALVFRPPHTSLQELEPQLIHNAVDPRSFFWPGDFQSAQLPGEAFRHTSYLGFVVIFLALRSRARTLLAASLVPLVLSLGPWLWVHGSWLTVGGLRVCLPYRLLFELLPRSTLGHPQRVGMPGIALIVALAARGLGGLRPRVAVGLAVGAVLELLLLSPAPWPVARTPTIDLAVPRAVRRLVSERGAGPRAIVLDLPADVGHTMRASQHLFYQSLHGFALPYKPDVRASTSSLGGLPAFRWLTGLDPTLPDSGLRRLSSSGVVVVVVHRDLMDEQERARVEAALVDWGGPPEVVGAADLFVTP